MEIKEKDFVIQTNNWDCCCSERPTDARLLKYIFTMTLIAIIMVFCLVMLFLKNDCQNQTAYISLIPNL